MDPDLSSTSTTLGVGTERLTTVSLQSAGSKVVAPLLPVDWLTVAVAESSPVDHIAVDEPLSPEVGDAAIVFTSSVVPTVAGPLASAAAPPLNPSCIDGL
jgi:hypothetical protein